MLMNAIIKMESIFAIFDVFVAEFSVTIFLVARELNL